MWKLIPELKFPPSRWRRYCCKYLKEQGGNLDKLGVPLPGFLRKIIEKLRTETEKEGDSDD